MKHIARMGGEHLLENTVSISLDACISSTHQYKTMLSHEDEEQCEVETVWRDMCSVWRDRCSVEGHGGTGLGMSVNV